MKKNLLTIFTLILFFTNCIKKDTSSIHLKLTSPINSSSQNPSGINFTWESDVIDSSKIVIASDADFKNIVSEFTTIENKYLPQITFQPNKTYYWKVTKTGEITSSSFKVNNVLNKITKEKVVANFHSYNWTMNGPNTNELFFIDTVTLLNNGDNLEFCYTKESIYQTLLFNNYASAPNLLFYKTANFGSNGCALFYNYLLNTVQIQNKVGGLGAGKIWEINF